jgi:hypothetical protein
MVYLGFSFAHCIYFGLDRRLCYGARPWTVKYLLLFGKPPQDGERRGYFFTPGGNHLLYSAHYAPGDTGGCGGGCLSLRIHTRGPFSTSDQVFFRCPGRHSLYSDWTVWFRIFCCVIGAHNRGLVDNFRFSHCFLHDFANYYPGDRGSAASYS